MAFKYLKNIVQLYGNPKTEMLDRYQQKVDARFDLATDVFDIEIEDEIGTNLYVPIHIRIDTVVSSETGYKMVDDYRKVIFKNPLESRGLGYKYKFDNSIWLTTNYDIAGKPTANTVIRKCRNILKWIDRYNGALYEEECVIDNPSMKENTPFQNDKVTIVTGFINIYVQNNERSKTITDNQRFYLNGKCWKVWSVYKAMSNPTDGKDPLIYITLGADEKNEQRDDIPNSVANYRDYIYKVNILNDGIEQSAGYVGKLEVETYLNDDKVERELEFESTDSSVVVVDNNGNYRLLRNGNANILCWIKGNKENFDKVSVSVSDNVQKDSEVIVVPEQEIVYQGSIQVYNVFEMIGGEKTDKQFRFEVVDNPKNSKNFTFDSSNGNQFAVFNIKRSSIPVVVKIYDGDILVKEKQIILKGAF